jgi:hypothetical protein
MKLRVIQVSAVWLAALLSSVAGAQVGGKDPVEDAVEAFDKQVGVAKKQFDASVGRTADNTVKRLISLGEGAARNKNEDFAARAFKEVLRIDRNNAQARAFFQQRNRLDGVLTELTVEWKPLVLVAPEARDQQVFYECMLGRYKCDRNWIAAVTLVIPDGGNVFNEAIRQRVTSGTGDPSTGKLTDYMGTGHLLVPADGVYSFTGPARAIKLNGQELSEIREKPVDVSLKKGVYSIEVAADERYTAQAAILIVDPRTRQRLPIFNSLGEIRRFLLEPNEANGPKRFDVSRWSPEQAMPLRISVPQE